MSDRTPTIEQSGIAIDALVIQRRYVWQNKGDLSLTVSVDATARHETLDEIMDNMSHVADREALKAERVERRRALDATRTQPLQMRREIDRLQAARQTYIAGAEAMWRRSGKRSEFALTAKHAADVDKFTAEIQNAEENIKAFARDIPLIEWEITVLDAKIAGKQPPELPPEVEAAMDAVRSGMAA